MPKLDADTLEKLRKETTRTVLKIAKHRKRTNNRKLIALLRKHFGNKKIRPLGEGCDRVVFSLPHQLVIKLEGGGYDSSHSNQNAVERRTTKNYPKYSPKIYGHYQSTNFHNTWDKQKGLNFLISERAITGSARISENTAAFRKLEKIFCDVGYGNVGLIDNRLVLIDLGLGTKMERRKRGQLVF